MVTWSDSGLVRGGWRSAYGSSKNPAFVRWAAERGGVAWRSPWVWVSGPTSSSAPSTSSAELLRAHRGMTVTSSDTQGRANRLHGLSYSKPGATWR
ncbi:hypothetical protein Krad_2617 [Kineococcus radiotolerans SRS30216 = ATCC BAA-149]|uniref:Uncharacterized protein n=1 Tax=Kineococcus radiotolerans (strain ATCC BAA-149 / DSM 14245 / SRS30216) TaxID=266940 RepID=A6WBA1_KINRD|nr:hypothetical protein Krad_2617 [Kineococcus radiotolerans SRS30216 = ATCC BAA-149]